MCSSSDSRQYDVGTVCSFFYVEQNAGGNTTRPPKLGIDTEVIATLNILLSCSFVVLYFETYISQITSKCVATGRNVFAIEY